MPEIEVRVERLEPMCVASVRVISDNPEEEAWEIMKEWAEFKGYLEDSEAHPLFGFNNPNPKPGKKEYGYEYWIRVPFNTQAIGDIKIKEFPGGLYAVTTHDGLPNPGIWMNLWNWVKSSPYDWRKTNELEKANNPLAPPEAQTFDLYLPITNGRS